MSSTIVLILAMNIIAVNSKDSTSNKMLLQCKQLKAHPCNLCNTVCFHLCIFQGLFWSVGGAALLLRKAKPRNRRANLFLNILMISEE